MTSTARARILMITADEALLDDVLRLCEAAGHDVELSQSEPTRSSWASAPLVLVGDDRAAAMAAMPRRVGVVLVTREPVPDAVWRDAVAVGAQTVATLPTAERWLLDRLADVSEGATRARVVGVVGGRGGAGASVFAAALAVTASATGTSVLLDADALGGGLDLLLGVEGESGLRWSDLAGARGRIPGDSLLHALPAAEGILLLSWDRGDALSVSSEAVRAVGEALCRTADSVVVDLPRRLDDASADLATRCDVVALVLPADLRATAAAARTLPTLAATSPDVRLVVREGAGSPLAASEVGSALGLPVAAVFRSDPRLPAAVDRGELLDRCRSGSLGRAARRLLDDVARPQWAA